MRAYDNRTGRRAGAEWIDYGLLSLSACRSRERDEPSSRRCLRGSRPRGELAGMPVRRRFYEIGTPEALAETERYLARQDRQPGPVRLSGRIIAG